MLGFGLHTGGVSMAPAEAVGMAPAAVVAGRLPTSISPRASNDRSRVLRTPQANNEFPNANMENVTERSR